jgi:TonB family protein
MKNSYLALICGILLFVVLSMAWCQPKSTSTSGTARSSAAPLPTGSATPAPSPTAFGNAPSSDSQSAELRNALNKTAPAVIRVSVFDSSGKLLRAGTGFFVSDDGKFVTNRHLVEGGINAIATTADKKIHNVTGIMAESTELNLALLKAETKQVPFLPLNKVATPDAGVRVAVVGSPLTRREEKNSETRIATRRSDEKGEWLDLSVPPANDASGSPVINEAGEVVGIATLNSEKNPAAIQVLSVSTVQSFLAKVQPGATARWPASGGELQTAEASPSPYRTPKVARKGKIIFNPAPAYPLEARGAKIAKGSGSYRIVFDTAGHAKNVQVLRSTGAAILDRAVVTALQQWKSEPGEEWSIVVPVTFQPGPN